MVTPTGRGEFFKIETDQIVETIGKASDGRNVMIICACKIPKDDQHFDYNLLRKYISFILDAHSDTEYYLLYFHCTSISETSSTKQWLRDLFHLVYDKESRINIKRFFIVHPTPFIRTMWYLAAPILMVKFKQKISYANTLKDLKKELPYNEMIFHLPIHVLEQDKLITENCKSNLQEDEKIHSLTAPLINAIHHQKSSEVMDALKSGLVVDLEDYKEPHMVAAVLKQLFREMPDPVIPYDLYDDLVAFNNEHYKLAAAKTIILYQLPKPNFKILAFLTAFLLRILDFKRENKMSPRRLATIFSPILARPKENHTNMNEMMIEMYEATEFLKYLLENFLDVFAF